MDRRIFIGSIATFHRPARRKIREADYFYRRVRGIQFGKRVREDLKKIAA
jgi:hypothetical protein